MLVKVRDAAPRPKKQFSDHRRLNTRRISYRSNAGHPSAATPCPKRGAPAIDRRGIITVRRCQELIHAGAECELTDELKLCLSTIISWPQQTVRRSGGALRRKVYLKSDRQRSSNRCRFLRLG